MLLFFILFSPCQADKEKSKVCKVKYTYSYWKFKFWIHFLWRFLVYQLITISVLTFLVKQVVRKFKSRISKKRISRLHTTPKKFHMKHFLRRTLGHLLMLFKESASFLGFMQCFFFWMWVHNTHKIFQFDPKYNPLDWSQLQDCWRGKLQNQVYPYEESLTINDASGNFIWSKY